MPQHAPLRCRRLRPLELGVAEVRVVAVSPWLEVRCLRAVSVAAADCYDSVGACRHLISISGLRDNALAQELQPRQHSMTAWVLKKKTLNALNDSIGC